MIELVDRYVIPIYNIEHTESFELESSINNITYKISLKTYSKHNYNYALINEEELKEVFKYGSLDSIKNFYSTMENDEPYLHHFTKTLLIIDFIHKNEKDNFYELFKAIIDSFHLIISNGMSYYKYFSFKSYSSNSFISYPGSSSLQPRQTFLTHTLHSKPYSFSPMLREKSFLKREDYKSVEQIIVWLFGLYTMEENQYSRVLKLSIEYHKLSISLEKIEQAFVLLMIIIEAMFKKEQDEKLSRYIKFIGMLLARNREDRGKIQKKFDSFIPLRNNIVHGDEFLEKDELKVKVLEIHEYVRSCILALLEINESKPLNNYYDDFFNEINEQWEIILS